MELTSIDGKRVHIRLNRVVSQRSATDIMKLLSQEDKL